LLILETKLLHYLKYAVVDGTQFVINITKENYAVLGYNAASSDNFSPTFRDYLRSHLQGSKIHCFWIIDLWKWDLYAVPKRRYEIITTCYVKTQNSAVFMYFVAEAWNQ